MANRTAQRKALSAIRLPREDEALSFVSGRFASLSNDGETAPNFVFWSSLHLLDHGDAVHAPASSSNLEPASSSGRTGAAAVNAPCESAMRRAVVLWSGTTHLDAKSLCKAHRWLMHGCTDAGQLRRASHCQVRCGDTGALVYVPPPSGQVPALLDDLAIHLAADRLPPLAMAFIAMLQLLLIHPFADGNGRCARALFAAICARGGLDHPVVLLALARLYGGSATRLHAGSHVLRATGDWRPYLDYCAQSIDEAVALWGTIPPSFSCRGKVDTASFTHALAGVWRRAMA